jgi:hypothetical protein
LHAPRPARIKPSLDFQEESRYELLAGASLGRLGSPDAAKETLDAEVFVDFGPMNALTVAEELPVSALLR